MTRTLARSAWSAEKKLKFFSTTPFVQRVSGFHKLSPQTTALRTVEWITILGFRGTQKSRCSNVSSSLDSPQRCGLLSRPSDSRGPLDRNFVRKLKFFPQAPSGQSSGPSCCPECPRRAHGPALAGGGPSSSRGWRLCSGTQATSPSAVLPAKLLGMCQRSFEPLLHCRSATSETMRKRKGTRPQHQMKTSDCV